MRPVTVLALTCGFMAAPVMAAGTASGTPSQCDGANCVPYVARNVAQDAPCDVRTRYVFGLDSSSGATLLCAAVGKWVPSKPLVGVRPLGAPCDQSEGAAQSPDGIPMTCVSQGWVANYTEIYYSNAV